MQFETRPAGPVPRRVVVSYPTYEEAQAAVEKLIEQRFPVEHLAIVGSDLKLVEQVTGRFDYANAAGLGAAVGAVVAFALALLSAAFVPGPPLVALMLYWLIGGALGGAIFGVVTHSRTAGCRDFSAVSRMEAARYDIMATDDVAHEVLSRLTENGTTPMWPATARR